MSTLLTIMGYVFLGLIAGFILAHYLLARNKKVVLDADSYILKKDLRPYVLKKDLGKLLRQSDFVLENIIPELLSLGHDTVLPLEVSSFIPLIHNALESRRNTDLWASHRNEIEDFFAAFPYAEATSYLLQVLDSTVSVPTDKVLGKKSLGKKEPEKRTIPGEEYSYGGSFGDEEGYYATIETVEIETFELDCDSYYPVAEGAKKSLTKIAESSPSQRKEIFEAIAKYDSRPKDVFKKKEDVETVIDREETIVVTEHHSSVR